MKIFCFCHISGVHEFLRPHTALAAAMRLGRYFFSPVGTNPRSLSLFQRSLWRVGWVGLLSTLLINAGNGSLSCASEPVDQSLNSGNDSGALSEVVGFPVWSDEWNSARPLPDQFLETQQEAGHRLFVKAALDTSVAPLDPQQIRYLNLSAQTGDMDAYSVLSAERKRYLKSGNKGTMDGNALYEEARIVFQQAQLHGFDSGLKKYERDLSDIQRKVPDLTLIHWVWLEMVQHQELDHAKQLLEDMVRWPCQENAISAARMSLEKMNRVGKTLSLKFLDYHGKEVSLDSFRGRVVLLYFWASWCAPCAADWNEIKLLKERYAPQDLAVIGINFDLDKTQFDTYIKDREIDVIQCADFLGWNNAAGRKFGIELLPAAWIIDRQGGLQDIQARSDLSVRLKRWMDSN